MTWMTNGEGRARLRTAVGPLVVSTVECVERGDDGSFVIFSTGVKRNDEPQHEGYVEVARTSMEGCVGKIAAEENHERTVAIARVVVEKMEKLWGRS